MSSSDDPKLPQDVVVEILKRLPVESLLRFRCVSRSWRSAIGDPRFVALHMNHSALDASKWRTLCLDWRDPLQKAFSLSSDESQLQLPFVTPTNCYCFVGSCNGLICVTELSSGYGRTMYLWNPSTRNYKVVRRSGLKHQFLSVETARLVVGFGFDARSHDYYIVRILYFPDDNHPGIGGTEPRVEIYSLRTDSWRGVQCEVPAIHHHHDKAVFLNGNLHWFAFKYDDMWEVPGSGSIVLFDIAGEVFDEMAPPEEVSQEDNGGVTVSVAVLDDLLAVFISLVKEVVGPKPHSVCSVWVMREYGVPESWTKLYTFKACGVVTRFDGFTRNGALLVEIFPGKRVSWNPITGQYAELPLSTTCNLVTVVESLVHFSDDSNATTVTGNAD